MRRRYPRFTFSNTPQPESKFLHSSLAQEKEAVIFVKQFEELAQQASRLYEEACLLQPLLKSSPSSLASTPPFKVDSPLPLPQIFSITCKLHSHTCSEGYPYQWQ